MDEQQIINENLIIESSKNLINENIYKFLLYLFKHIFITQSKTKKAFNAMKILNSWIKIINEKIIIKKENFISTYYTIDNFRNIIKFVKTQNKLYAGDIIENILMIIFSLGFKTNKENTFAKYLYNNLFRIKQPSCTILAEWFDNTKFKPDELKNFKNLLNEGPYIENIEKNIEMTESQKNNIFFKLLVDLYYEKKSFYEIKFEKKLKNYKEEKENIDETYLLTDKIEKMEKKTLYTSIINDEYHHGSLDKSKTNTINLTKSFFITVFIYYQNKYSPLMKYIPKSEQDESNENKELASIPFTYDFSSGVIRSEFAEVVMAPARIEPRINKFDMSKNILKEKGLVELSKILIFNRYIKIIDFHTEAIKTIYLDFLNQGFGIFDNYYVEELDISGNYIKEDSYEILGQILSHLKGLKTINLSMNKLGKGINSFLIMLKFLYRRKNVKVENLYLNNCMLDYSSFYELGRLLNCRYCKLKNLCLNKNKIPINFNFLKRLKKNKSLTEIYLNNCDIRTNNTEDILRIMSNTNAQSIYLYNNELKNFNNCLRIINRTKFISKKMKRNQDLISRTDSLLYNLDLSDNNIICKNTNHIKLLDKIINETTLYCLDFNHILFESDPNNYINTKKYSDYQKEVIQLRDKLNEYQKHYVEDLEMINSNELKIEKLKTKEFMRNEKIEKEIEETILDNNAIFPVFLREKSKIIINQNKEFFQGKEEEEIGDNLRKYMEFKLANKMLEKLKSEREKRKLIII